MPECSKCHTRKSDSQFPYRDEIAYASLTRFQRQRCKRCWAGIPFSKALKKGEGKKRRRALKIFLRKRAEASARSNKRRAAEIQATPAWANQEKIREIYIRCAETTGATGIVHHVDHICPPPWKIRVRHACGI